MGMNESATAIGSERIGSSALRKWSRKRKMTRLTTSTSSSSACVSVSMERSIRPERS